MHDVVVIIQGKNQQRYKSRKKITEQLGINRHVKTCIQKKAENPLILPAFIHIAFLHQAVIPNVKKIPKYLQRV